METKRPYAKRIANMSIEDMADFIVAACNAHEDLVSLLLEIKGRGVFDPQQDSTGEKIEIALAKAGVKV